MKRNHSLLVLVQCALLLAIGLVFRYFSQMIPIAGVGGMRLSISVFFTKIPAILFGPFYGAAVCGLADFLGWLIRPDEGAYIFPMTVTAAIGGLLAGIIFKYIKNIKLNKQLLFRTVYQNTDNSAYCSLYSYNSHYTDIVLAIHFLRCCAFLYHLSSKTN